MTGEVVALREVLHRYRASPKVLPSSTTSVVEAEDSDDYIEVTGTDGQMKNLEGQFVVVDNSMEYELSRPVVTSKPEATTMSEKTRAATPLEEGGSEVVETSAPVNGKRKADDDVVEEHAEKRVCL